MRGGGTLGCHQSHLILSPVADDDEGPPEGGVCIVAVVGVIHQPEQCSITALDPCEASGAGQIAHTSGLPRQFKTVAFHDVGNQNICQ